MRSAEEAKYVSRNFVTNRFDDGKKEKYLRVTDYCVCPIFGLIVK